MELVSTDWENENEEIPGGIFIPKQAPSWGGRSTNKIAKKWRIRVAVRSKRREWKEASNLRIRPKGKIWKNMINDGNLQESIKSSMMFNTK